MSNDDLYYQYFQAVQKLIDADKTRLDDLFKSLAYSFKRDDTEIISLAYEIATDPNHLGKWDDDPIERMRSCLRNKLRSKNFKSDLPLKSEIDSPVEMKLSIDFTIYAFGIDGKDAELLALKLAGYNLKEIAELIGENHEAVKKRNQRLTKKVEK